MNPDLYDLLQAWLASHGGNCACRLCARTHYYLAHPEKAAVVATP